MIDRPQFPMNPVLGTDTKLERESYTNLMAWAIQMQNSLPPPWSVGISNEKQRYCFAQISADNGDGTYDADEVLWDTDSSDWVLKSGGHDFNGGSDFPSLIEANLATGVAVGTTVLAYTIVDDAGDADQWIFFQSSSYEGPHACAVGTLADDVDVGVYRDSVKADVTTIYQADGTVDDITAVAADTVNSVTSNGWIYYQVHRGASWTQTAAHSAVWPPAASNTNKDDTFRPIAYVTADSTGVQSVFQLQYGTFEVRERPILENGQAYYNNDQMTVNGQTVNLGGTTQAIASLSTNLSANTKVFVQATYTVATDTWVITSTYQTTTGAVVFRSLSSGVYTLKFLVAEISSGEILQRRIGNIEYPGVYPEDSDEKVASQSGQTANYLSLVITNGTDNAFDTEFDVPVKGDVSISAANVKLYCCLDELTDYGTSWTVGGVIAISPADGSIRFVDLDTLLREISGHGASKTLTTDGSGNIQWS